MNVNFDINAMLKSVIEDFQNIARNVKISFKIRRLNDDKHRINGEIHHLIGETDCHCERSVAISRKGNNNFINKRQSPACFRAGGIFNNDTGRNLICYQR